MIKVSIVGATGYSGQEIVRLLSGHEKVKIKYLSSQSYVGKKYNEVYKNSSCDLECVAQDVEKFAKESDVIFLALPHSIASKEVTASVLGKTKVIDLGADFRLKDKDVYEKWYGVTHYGTDILPQAVYGLPEINREQIKSAKLVATPGCYPTCTILGLAPLVKNGLVAAGNVVIDAKSGVSGAGRSLDTQTLYCECNETIKAYKIAAHRHTPEIEQGLNELCPANNALNNVTFVPHLTPMNRGMLVTSYVNLTKDISQKELQELYTDFYKNEHFVRVDTSGNSVETRWVKGSNYCDIGVFKDERTGKVIVTSALDNLLKGAAGQAVQNLNIMFGIDEQTGLKADPIFP